MARPAEVEVPAEWEEVARGGPGPFITWIEYRDQDGASQVWSARAHRKGHGARRAHAVAGPGYRAYDRLAWWVAVLFLVGSVFFSDLELIPSEVGLWWTSLIGGLLFLIAALLQMLEVGNGRTRENFRDVSWQVALWFVIGSIGFTVGALPGMVHAGEVPFAKVEPGALIVKLGFLIGGIAFLVGSWLMLPELDQELRKEVDEPRQTK